MHKPPVIPSYVPALHFPFESHKCYLRHLRQTFTFWELESLMFPITQQWSEVWVHSMDSQLFEVEHFNMSINFFSYTTLFQGPDPVMKWKVQYKQQFLILIKLHLPKGSFGVAIPEWKLVFLFGIGSTWGYLDNMEQSCWISKGSNCTFTSSSAFLKNYYFVWCKKCVKALNKPNHI